MHPQRPEQGAGRVEKGRGIVIAGRDHHMAAGRVRRAAQEAVIKLLRAHAGRAGVEDIAGNQQGVGLPLMQHACQPVEKGGKLVMPSAAEKRAAEMPVGTMQNFHSGHRLSLHTSTHSPPVTLSSWASVSSAALLGAPAAG